MRFFSMPAAAVLGIMLLLTGCTAYSSLKSEDDIPRLAALKRAAATRPTQTVHVRAGEVAGRPLYLAVHQTGPGGQADSSGRVVVLIHGVLSDSRTWRFVVAGLAEKTDVWAIDLPGCGDSDHLDPNVVGENIFTIESQARALLEALRQSLAQRQGEGQGLSKNIRLTLAGHSLGGTIILRMFMDQALRHDYADVLSHVDGIVLISTVDIAMEKPNPVAQMLAGLSGWEAVLADALGYLRERVADEATDTVENPAELPRQEADREYEILRDGVRRRAGQAFIRRSIPWHTDTDRPDWPAIEALEARYADVHIPTLLVFGARDEVLGTAPAYKLMAQLPSACLRIVENSMHCLPTERPEAVSKLIDGFYPAQFALEPKLARTDSLGQRK